MKEENLDEFSFKELLAYSIKSEKAAQKFYNDFAEAAIGELVKERFKSLAKDEEVHEAVLQKRYEAAFGDEDYDIPDSDKLPPHETSYDFSSARNIIDSLEKGMENEKNAREIYKYMAKRFEEHSSFFEYIALMEKGHYESLSEEKLIMEGETSEQKEGDGDQAKSFWKNMVTGSDSALGDRSLGRK